MDKAIQDMLDNVPSNGIAKLPNGEFEGPFIVNKSCTIKGNCTTLWSDKGPVLIVKANNTYLKNLRLEITGATSDFSRIALQNDAMFLNIDQVEIDGNVAGVASESGWVVPKAVNLGSFKSNETNTFILKIYNDNDAEIRSDIMGLTVSPSYLHRGLNIITLSTDGIRDKTCIYGELILKSSFTRKIFVSGRVSSESEIASGKIVFSAEMDPLFMENFNSMKFSSTLPSSQIQGRTYIPDGHEALTPTPNNMPKTQTESVDTSIRTTLDLQKGQRISLGKSDTIKVRIKTFSQRRIEADTYAFELNQMTKVLSDKCLIFFGNTSSPDNALEFKHDDTGDEIIVHTEKIQNGIEKIQFISSVYNENGSTNNFGEIEYTDVSVQNDTSVFHYRASEKINTESLLTVEIYLYKGEWKLKVISEGINHSIADICNDYGVTVD